MISNPSEWTTMSVLSAFTWGVSILVSLFIVTLSWLRPSYPGWRGWAVGQTALVLGVLVGSLRTPETLLASVVIGNTLVMVGSTLCLGAFQRFSGQVVNSWVSRLAWGICASIVVALILLTTVWDNIALRFVLVSGYTSTLLLMLINLIAGQMRRHPALRLAYGLNLGVLLGGVLLTLPRSHMMVSASAHLGFTLNGPNVLLHSAALLLSVGGSFAFWLLHDDRRRQEMQHLYDELLVQTTLDPLTTLLNRRGLSQAYEVWQGQAADAALLLLDINEFKGINDQHGHAEGDRCLVRLAGTLRTIAQPGDLVSRVGGDEFVLLLIGAEEQVVAQIKGLEGLLAKGQQGVLGFTVSLGKTRVRAGEDLAQAMNRADQGMYSAKARGMHVQHPRMRSAF
ncbi:GGDEF domain-containing protein [Deinococcus aquatilis]|jgi:diguanylate cyclase (GGDEF)-like protein|uniref:GGDEF domain-containing protein n=1 Tax=Deinococcus aquatilis TaxID=519440 RepID=UPI0003999171|nr:GGDEF domain-containing protein [Deinococcus aquatilis]